MSIFNKNAILYSVFLLTISNIGLQILGFVYRIFLSRMISAESMGVYQLIFPFYSVIMAISLSGICIAVSRLSAEKYVKGDIKAVKQLVYICVALFVILFVVVAILTSLFSDFIASNILGDSRTRVSLIILLPCLFLTGFENIYKSCFYGIKKVYPPIITELSEQVLRISAVALLLGIFRPVTPTFAVLLIVIGMVVSEVMSATLLTFFFRRYVKTPQPMTARAIFSPPIIKDIIIITLPITAAGLMQNLLSSINTVLVPRRLIVSGIAAKEATEMFGILFGMTMPLLMLPAVFIGALSTIMLPRLSECVSLNLMERARDRIGKTLYVTALLTFPVFAILIPLGEPVCRLLYNQAAASHYLTPLAISSVFVYYAIITGSILNGIGMQKRVAVHVGIGGVVQLIFTYFAVAIPGVGIYGYVAGYCASAVIVSIMNMHVIIDKTKLKLKWFKFFIEPLLNAALISLLSNITFKLTDAYLMQGAAVAITCISMIVLYIFLLWLQGVDATRYVVGRLFKS